MGKRLRMKVGKMVSEEKNMVNCEIRECKFLESDDVLKEIRRLIGESDEVRIAVAYLKEKGYNEIKDALREFLEKEKHFFWLLVGIAKYYITDADPLDELLELQRKNKNIKLKCSPNCGFHPKVCIFRTGKDVSVIIGSSNLTGGGLGENTEANILIRGDEGDEVIKNILNFYYRIWQWPDFGLLDKRILDIYRKNKENKKRFDRKFE
ncbi:MAG: NgoFVII family restriction endonuclease, partial [Nanoarchaeota archaeon]|nr:NgoFVII family restriction endonuclease [Nanoarchaeota archaeon]